MHPLFHVGALALRAYPTIVTAGVLFCWLLLVRRTTRLGYERAPVLTWVLVAFPVGAAGAALFAKFVAIVLGHSIAGVTGDGLSVLGGICACLLYSAVYVPVVFREPPWRLLDAVAFTLPIATGIGRIGCLMNGCCFGKPAPEAVPLAVRPFVLRTSSLAPDTDAARHYVASTATTLWNLPALFLVECAVVLAIAEFAWSRRARWKLRSGSVVAITLCADALGRFVVEFRRADEVLAPIGLNPWQTSAGILAVLAALAFVRNQRAPLRDGTVHGGPRRAA